MKRSNARRDNVRVVASDQRKIDEALKTKGDLVFRITGHGTRAYVVPKRK